MLINTRWLSFHHFGCYYYPPDPTSKRSREQFSVCPQLVALPLRNARLSPSKRRASEPVHTGRHCSGMQPWDLCWTHTPAEHPEKGINSAAPLGHGTPWFTQVAPGVKRQLLCPKHKVTHSEFPSSALRSYTKHKHNLRAERAEFWISIGLLSPNCLKLKFICILCRNINKRPQMYLYLYILQEPSKIIHRTKINLL